MNSSTVLYAAALLAVSISGCQVAAPAPDRVAATERASTNPILPVEARSPEKSPPPASSRRSSDAITPTDIMPASPDYENNVYFDLGRTNINQRGYQTLVEHAERMKAKTEIVVTLVGHTDRLGSRAYSLAISDARLDAVARFLKSHGIKSQQIRQVSLGNEKKITTQCRSEDCRRSMRRVELVYAPPHARVIDRTPNKQTH